MNIQLVIFILVSLIHRKLRNINLHDIAHSPISRNPRERMFIVQNSLLIVTFLSLVSRFFLKLMQTTKVVNPHPHIAICVNMWSVFFSFFFFLCHLLNVGACIWHIVQEGQVRWTTPNGGERRMNSNSIVSHAVLILWYHASMLILQNFVI